MKLNISLCPSCREPKVTNSTVCRACYLLARKAGASNTGTIRAWLTEKKTPSDDEAQDAFERVNALAVRIADAHAAASIISSCIPEDADGETWYDLNGYDDCGVAIRNSFSTEIEYCEARNLLHHHPTRPNIVQEIED